MTSPPASCDPDLAALHAALWRGAEGLYAAQAGVGLLLRHGHWPRQLWRAGLIRTSTTHDTGELLYAQTCWREVNAGLERGELAGSGSDRRVLLVAASLAGAVPVELGDAVCGLDRRNLILVLKALAHANGAHQHPAGDLDLDLDLDRELDLQAGHGPRAARTCRR